MVLIGLSLHFHLCILPDADDYVYQTLIMLLLIPLPLFFASTVFGVRGLTAWVVIGIIWCFCSAFTVVLYPLWESRAALAQISRGIIKVRQSFERVCTCYRLVLSSGRISSQREAESILRRLPQGWRRSNTAALWDAASISHAQCWP